MSSIQYTEPQNLNLEVTLEDMNKLGEVALFFANSVLGKTASEAWMDAFMAFNIENYKADSVQLQLTLHNLFQYALTVIHDFGVMKEAAFVDLPLQNERYMFGWWLNCLNSGHCFLPHIPRDVIFSVSSTLRIYISPTFELTLIISDTKSDIQTFNDVIKADAKIWEQIYSALMKEDDGNGVQSERVSVDLSATTDKTINKMVHWAWPILVFIFWVVSSHVWVYWMFHCCWFVATSVSKRTHVSRPQNSKE